MDWSTIIVGVLALIGTFASTFAGISTGTKLTVYRLEQLEKKVDKHNSVVERTYLLEEKVGKIETKLDLMYDYNRDTHGEEG